MNLKYREIKAHVGRGSCIMHKIPVILIAFPHPKLHFFTLFYDKNIIFSFKIFFSSQEKFPDVLKLLAQIHSLDTGAYFRHIVLARAIVEEYYY